MDAGLVLRIYLIAVGIFMISSSIRSLVKKKMIEHFCHVWGLIALVFFVLGIVIQPSGLATYISTNAMIMLLAGLSAGLYIAWEMTISISVLTRQNRELAMQIALLNQENISCPAHEEDTIRH